MHELEGGEDRVGSQRLGIAELQRHMDSLYSRHGVPEAWDDMNDVFLDASAVRRARAEEMEFFKKLGVYKRVPRSRFAELNGKMTSVKWLDTNKGDRLNPNHRSRLVAREFNQGKDDTLYASTPPLEAMRLIVSHASTIDPENPNVRRDLMVNDVRRAYFYAMLQRLIFIKLPEEDDEAKEDEVGQLLLCLTSATPRRSGTRRCRGSCRTSAFSQYAFTLRFCTIRSGTCVSSYTAAIT